MKRFNVGIIGYGFMGKVHAYGYMNLPLFYDPPPARARLVGICDSIPEAARRAQDDLGFEFCTSDFREITENPKIDIVDVCTPNVYHKDALISAIRHGKHIYCDKPLTATVAEARDVIAAMKDYRGVNQMAMQYPFFPAALRAKELIAEGFLGELLSFRAAYLHAGSIDPSAPLRWKLNAAVAGGGVLVDLGTHIIQATRELVGEFDEILCATKIAFPDRPSADDPHKRVPVTGEDMALLLVRTRAGALGVIEASKIDTGAQDELCWELHGTKGGLRFNCMDPNYLEAYDATAPGGPTGGRQGWLRIETVQRYPKPAAPFPGPKFSVGWIRTHMACLHNFLAGVAEGRPVKPDFRECLRVQEIMQAAYDSAATRAWVKVQ